MTTLEKSGLVIVYKFSQRSISNLEGCVDELQYIAYEAIKHVDFTVIEGHRTLERQMQLYNDGFTTLKDGSKHNKFPSHAFDFIPYPFTDWHDKGRFMEVANVLKELARDIKADITWGGDWKSFVDLPHIQVNK